MYELIIGAVIGLALAYLIWQGTKVESLDLRAERANATMRTQILNKQKEHKEQLNRELKELDRDSTIGFLNGLSDKNPSGENTD